MQKTIMVLAFACVFAVALAFGCTCGDKNKGKAELKGEYTIELYSDYTLP